MKKIFITIFFIVFIFVALFIRNSFRTIDKQCRLDGCNGEICSNKKNESVPTGCMVTQYNICREIPRSCKADSKGVCSWTNENIVNSCLELINKKWF